MNVYTNCCCPRLASCQVGATATGMAVSVARNAMPRRRVPSGSCLDLTVPNSVSDENCEGGNGGVPPTHRAGAPTVPAPDAVLNAVSQALPLLRNAGGCNWPLTWGAVHIRLLERGHPERKQRSWSLRTSHRRSAPLVCQRGRRIIIRLPRPQVATNASQRALPSALRTLR